MSFLSIQPEIADRINKAVKHIEQHLSDELPLEDLAALAHFSPFHFQRIFKEVTGETPKQLIKRLRLEEAAHFIVLYPQTNMLEVALRIGFQSLESFSRAFKNYYNISPDNFRKSSEETKIKLVQNPELSDKFLKTPSLFLSSIADISEIAEKSVEIVRLPPQKIIYIQTTLESTANITASFRKIKQWALARELVKPESFPFGLMKDYPLFTALDKCRYLTCMAVEVQPEISGAVHYMEQPQSTFAVFNVKGNMSEIIQSVTNVVKNWLPESGYQFVHEPAFEIPLYDPLTTPFDSNSYRIMIQIRPK